MFRHPHHLPPGRDVWTTSTAPRPEVPATLHRPPAGTVDSQPIPRTGLRAGRFRSWLTRPRRTATLVRTPRTSRLLPNSAIQDQDARCCAPSPARLRRAATRNAREKAPHAARRARRRHTGDGVARRPILSDCFCNDRAVLGTM
jgi:hypothetical protein